MQHQNRATIVQLLEGRRGRFIDTKDYGVDRKAVSKTESFIVPVSANDIGKIKSPLDRLFEKVRGGGIKGWERKFKEMGGSSKGIYAILRIYRR